MNPMGEEPFNELPYTPEEVEAFFNADEPDFVIIQSIPEEPEVEPYGLMDEPHDIEEPPYLQNLNDVTSSNFADQKPEAACGTASGPAVLRCRVGMQGAASGDEQEGTLCRTA